MSAETGSVLDRTLSGLAHELNNPLAAISGFAQILLRGTPNAEDRHAIETILSEARRATQLIRDFITIARGDVEGHPERVDINTIVLRAVASCRSALEAKGVALQLDLHPDGLLVEAPPSPTERIARNLLRSAFRHPALEGVRPSVRVSTRREGDLAVLEVADDGPTLSAAAIESVWDPFAVTGDDTDVSGFELAVARSLANAQGAAIAARPAAGSGTIFSVAWPCAPDSARPAEANASNHRQPLDVLVVEDEEMLRDMLARLLELRGHAVVIANSGEQALRLAEHNAFDVVVSDVRLPGLSGPDFVHRLRTRPGYAGTRVILATGDSEMDDTALAREGLTGVHLIHKPFDLADLSQLIESAPLPR